VAEWNGGRVFYRLDYPDGCLPADEVLDRAFSRLGERHYNPLTNNCEHFARWCKIARPVSLQVTPRYCNTCFSIESYR
jgi:hypothetical protein